MKKILYLILVNWFVSMSAGIAQKPVSVTGYVNPFIGTGGHGHTYPGVSLPFGMVQAGPDTRLDGWDGCSGYHASDTIIYGFSHTHLSGTGCSDYGDILVMPVTGNTGVAGYSWASTFNSSTEVAQPGFYHVLLSGTGISVDLTATRRTAMHRYLYPEGSDPGVLIDLIHRDKVLESNLKIINDTMIEGMRISQSWAKRQILYFVIKFSRPFSSFVFGAGDEIETTRTDFDGEEITGFFRFSSGNTEPLLLKVGISAVSTEGAWKNLNSENPGWDFEEIRNDARVAWTDELQKIDIGGGTTDQKRVFYTSLYHALLNPNLYMDVDGKYRGRDLAIHQAKGFDYYTVFSLWDTYRAAHPLFTLIDQKRTTDFIHTFIHQYQEGGLLPVWELSANETFCMIGYHAVPVIADAYVKGIRDYDAETAFQAMKHSAEQDHFGLKQYKSKGYIPGDQEGESVSKTLEYAYDDWCIAQMAKLLGKRDDYRKFIRRAQSYKNIFDIESGFMRAKMNESWFSPFDPYEVNFNYTEANAWQYSMYVPQDISGFIEMMGSTDRMIWQLDTLFSATTKTTGRDQADITGLIGQYAHGNEPSHHMAYLYDYVGQPWKTQALVHQIMKEFYKNDKDGLCGNEDCGQMSAWYVFSALGFYPVTPGSTTYAIGTPLFPEATIHLENGKTFTIKANHVNDNNFYIQSCTLNGNTHEASSISHEHIMAGGELVFEMGPEPNKSWGVAPDQSPRSEITDYLILPVPYVSRGQSTFFDSTAFILKSPDPNAQIFYTLDGTEPQRPDDLYTETIVLKETTTLKAFAFRFGMDSPQSNLIEATFVKIPEHRKISLNTTYAPQYSAGGDVALIDFKRGGENFRTGAWQGYEGVNLDVIIDLGDKLSISKLALGSLQDIDSWIFFPIDVEFYTSMDGKVYQKAGITRPGASIEDEQVATEDLSIRLKRPVESRFLRVVAKNRKTCPTGHPGAGKPSWIFADEILIN